MLVVRSSIRRFSATPIASKLFSFSELSSPHDRQRKIEHFIDTHIRKGDTVYTNFVHDIMQHWDIEQPTREALWTCESHTNESQKLTFDQILQQIGFKRVESQFILSIIFHEFYLTN